MRDMFFLLTMKDMKNSKGLRAFYELVMGEQKGRKKIAIVAVFRKLSACKMGKNLPMLPWLCVAPLGL